MSSAKSMQFGIDLGALLSHLKIPVEFGDVVMSVDAHSAFLALS